MDDKREGVVTRFGARGFGYLLDPKTRIQYFFHITDVIGRKSLQTGDKVTFLVGNPKPGASAPPAILVDLVESPASKWVRP
jgi:cold shock CspA family protein